MKDNSLTVLLFTTICLLAQALLAQETIDLPKVHFNEPDVVSFDLNDGLHLHVTSNVPVSELRVRVFHGSKQELISRKKHTRGACVLYGSMLFDYSAHNGEVKFDWSFDYKYLQVRDNGFANEEYTVVLERASKTYVGNFRLYPDDVENYFNSGQQIMIVAPSNLRTGTEAKRLVAELRPPQSTTGSEGSKNAIGNSQGGFVPPPERVTCLVIKTFPAPSRSSAERPDTPADPARLPVSSTELVTVPCRSVGR